jgi:hypothetical protein
MEDEFSLPTAEEAWNSMTDPDLEIHDLTREVAKFFGGSWGIKTTPEPEITRTQFTKSFEAARERYLRKANGERFRNHGSRAA